MNNIKKMAIVASISVASLSAVADQNDEVKNKALTLKAESTEKQGIVIPADQLKTTELFAKGGCAAHGEVPHKKNSIWDTLKDIFSPDCEGNSNMAGTQLTKSLDDDFA